MQAVAALAVLAKPPAQVGRLLRQDIDRFLQGHGLAIEPGDALTQIAKIALGFRQAALQLHHLLAQFAQLALARQDAGLRVMRADGYRAVGIEHLSLQGDEAMAAGVPGDGAGRIQVPDDQRLAKQLCRQIAQLRMLAGDQVLCQGHDPGVGGHAFG